MNRISLAALSAVVMTGLLSPITAQEVAPTTTEAATDAPAAPVQQPGVAESADKAEIGQAYWGAVNGDWKSRCFKSPEGDDPCDAEEGRGGHVVPADGDAVLEAGEASAPRVEVRG